MKYVKLVLFPALVLLLVMLAVPVSAGAPPGLPHNFSGTVKIGTADAPVGTVISARHGGVEYGTVTTTQVGVYSNLLVTGLTNGDIIQFFVNNIDTGQTYAFESGATTALNLVAPIVDTTPPSVTINQASGQADPTNASPINFTVVFSEPVSDFATGDVTLSGTAGATTATVTGSGTTYNVAVSGMTSDGTVIASIAAGKAHDAAGNPNAASTSTDNTVTYDTTHPTVTITSTATSPTNVSPIPITATFSEDVTGFVVGDITVGNGTAGNFVAVSGTVYTFAVTPAAGGVVTVDIAADVAQDAAGNGNTAATQFSITYTTAPPAVTINPVTSPTNVATQTLTGTMSEGATVVLTADTAATFGAVTYPTTTTWSCNVTLVEGANTITATVATGTATVTVVLDTVAPTVTGTSPAADATGVPVNTVVAVIFSEPMKASTITTSSFTLSGSAVSGTVTYNSATYTATFTPSANLTVGTTYTATLSTAITDAAGNPLASAYSWSFTTIAGSLGDEIAGASPGGTVELGAGTYSGDVIIDKPITITGTAGTIIMGGITIGELTGSNVTIENLTITGYTDFGIRIVKVRAVDTFIIRNNTIQGVAGSIIGIRVDEVVAGGSLTIEQNSISGNQTGIKLLAAVADATIKFNNITNNTTAGLEILAVGSNAKAEMNWWGDISGPQCPNNPGGTGDKIVGDISYLPWLTRAFQTVLTDNIAYFGFPWVHLNTGWNTFSTPIALDPACDTWGEYKALGNGLNVHATSPAYSFNSQTQAWVALTASYDLKPCDAIYVRMASPDVAPILYSPNVSVPSKQLYSGWNLVGLAYLGDISGLKANQALVSVEEVSGGLTGYKLVVSPPVNQPGWIYTGGAIADWNGEGEPPAGWMLNNHGYWVFMLNDGTLAGFTFTPRPL